ncbi:unnamed protein product, partial [Musa hybrid cultivar]
MMQVGTECARRKTMMCDPPFDRYRDLFIGSILQRSQHEGRQVVEEHELPMIDLRSLRSENEEERVSCVSEIVRASSDWGFFQVLNHGVSNELLGE